MRTTDINYLGCMAEYNFCTSCTSQGYIVSMPILDSSPYDVVVDTHQAIYKVQVKYTARTPRYGRNTVHIPILSRRRSYTVDNVDFFAIYTEYFGGFFVIPNPGEVESLRLSTTGKYSVYFNNFAFNP